MRKIIVVSLGVILVSCLFIVVWSTTNRTEDRESTFDSGVDKVSGVDYSTTITGGEEGTSLAVLGLTNLESKGVRANDVEAIRQYASHLAMTKFQKKIDDVISISKDDIEFTVGEGAVDTTYSFRVYLDSKTFIIGRLVTPLEDDTQPKRLHFYSSTEEIIQTYDI